MEAVRATPEQLRALRVASQYSRQGVSLATLETRARLENPKLVAGGLVQLKLFRYDKAAQVYHITDRGREALRSD